MLKLTEYLFLKRQLTDDGGDVDLSDEQQLTKCLADQVSALQCQLETQQQRYEQRSKELINVFTTGIALDILKINF